MTVAKALYGESLFIFIIIILVSLIAIQDTVKAAKNVEFVQLQEKQR
jgi:hypothetical protein